MSDSLPRSYSQEFRADDEIDLLEVVKTLWAGKWTIVGITAFVSSIALAVLIYMPSWFNASTKIKSLSYFAADAYAESNAFGFFVVDREGLLDDFIAQLDDRKLFVDATKALSLVSRDDYDSEALYEEEVLEFVESLQLSPPANEDGLEQGESRRNWELVAEYYDEDKWLEALRYVERAANAEISAVIRQRFATAVTVAEQEREFDLQDLATKVANAQADYDLQMSEFGTRLAFNLEDVSIQIDNALADYDRTTSDRLAFLREQAAIARKLEVAKNTIEAQTFAAQNSILTSVETDTPFYLRGYEAIEKEIELIESREDKRAFVSGLLDLEKAKRKLDQDQTLQRMEQEKQFLEGKLELERQMRALEQDQTIERARDLFEVTPAWTGDGFEAAAFTPEGTVFDAKISKLMILILVGLLSGMLSCIYVLIVSAMRKSAASGS
jgi:LPS O-antigen subunit length determinant protein (WzzB/FepE family)